METKKDFCIKSAFWDNCGLLVRRFFIHSQFADFEGKKIRDLHQTAKYQSTSVCHYVSTSMFVVSSVISDLDPLIFTCSSHVLKVSHPKLFSNFSYPLLFRVNSGLPLVTCHLMSVESKYFKNEGENSQYKV